MTPDIIITFVIIILAVFLFVTEKLSIDTISILTMIALMTTGILTPAEGFAGFMNDATITVGVLFVLSAAIFKSGALNGVTRLFSRAGKLNYFFCLASIMIFSGLISAFINDTAVVALFLPVVIQVARESNISPGKLLMPLSFGALMGGVCTLIGTSTNILVSGITVRYGEPPIGMFEMTGMGIWFLVIGIAYMLLAGQFLLPNRKTEDDLAESYNMGNYLTEILLLPDSSSVGKTVTESSLVKDIDIEILQIQRQGTVLDALPYTVLEANDHLRVRCDVEKLKRMDEDEKVQILADKTRPEEENTINLLEAVIVPNSSFIGHSLKDINFRNKYLGSSVLAIRSRAGILHENLAEIKLQSGDMLLIKVQNQQKQLLRRSRDFLIISDTKRTRPDYRKILPTLLIVIGAIAAAALNIAPIILTASVAALLLVVFNFISPEEAYQSIEWKVIFMLAGVLSMGAALEKTGAAALLAQGITSTAGSLGPRFVLSLFFLVTFLSTNIMSNNATAALLVPIAIVTAESMGVSPRPFIMSVTFAASLSFMTPMGYQTNTMIYGPGKYVFKDYLRVGTPLNIIFWILASILIPIYFPL